MHIPREQQYHLFHNAVLTANTEIAYAVSFQKALKAALALDERTQGLDIIFKSRVKADLDLLFFENTLEVNEK